jgi:glucose-1-phosphatase
VARKQHEHGGMNKLGRPQLVIFDMDDVLCHYDVGRRLRYLAEIASVTARDVRAACWDSGFEDLADSGGYPDSENYLEEFSRRIGKQLTVAEWVEARRIAMTPNQDVIALSAAIKPHADLAIYTNNGPLVKQNFSTLLPEATRIIEKQFCSYEFNTKKPDPLAYTRLLQHLGISPSVTWFIDDKRSNVEGARIAGLTAHHFRDYARLRDEAVAQGFEL